MPIDLPPDSRLFDALTAIASRAAAAILEAGAAPPVRLKADNSPVTAADEAAEATILEELARLLPGVPVISEEAVARGEVPALGANFILVDPLDGTREFIAGLTEYTVNIGLIADGAPVLGIIAAPALGLVWRGVVGRRAERMRLPPGATPDAGIERTALRTRRAPQRLIATVSRSYPDPATNAFIDRMPEATRLTCGSSLKFCQIAEGTADVYPRLVPPMQWDIAAGHAIVVAAGGIVAQPDGSPLLYGTTQEGFRASPFIAWGDPEAATRHRS